MADTYTPPNPAVEWYNEWSGRTPLVTRYTLQALCLLYVLSWFSSGVSLALANIPYYTILKFEVYRLLTAPLFCNSLLSLLFVCLSFSPLGCRMEHGLGSAKFLILIAVVGVVSNAVFVVFCFLMAAFGTYEALLFQCQGFWVVLLGLIAIDSLECMHEQPTRQLFMIPVNIPTVYYPLALLALFTLFAGPNLGMVIGCAFGYAYASGRTPAVLKPSSSAVSGWERGGCLANLTFRPGYVPLSAALGAGGALSAGGEWGSSSSSAAAAAGAGSSATSSAWGQRSSGASPDPESGRMGWGAYKVVDRNRPTSAPSPSAPPAEDGDGGGDGAFPGGGHTLSSSSGPSWRFGGGAPHSGAAAGGGGSSGSGGGGGGVDPAVARAARLAALEKRSQANAYEARDNTGGTLPSNDRPAPSAPPLLPPPPSARPRDSSSSSPWPLSSWPNLQNQLEAMGYPPEISAAALARSGGDLDGALNLLMTK